jgi:hypothetical protein
MARKKIVTVLVKRRGLDDPMPPPDNDTPLRPLRPKAPAEQAAVAEEAIRKMFDEEWR